MPWWTQNQWLQDYHKEKKPNWEKRWQSYFPTGSVTNDTVWFKQTPQTQLNTNWTPQSDDPWEMGRLTNLWNTLPTMKRNELGRWEDAWRNAWLQAMSYGKGAVDWEGQQLPGEMVAGKIEGMYQEYLQQKEQARMAQQNKELDWRIA